MSAARRLVALFAVTLRQLVSCSSDSTPVADGARLDALDAAADSGRDARADAPVPRADADAATDRGTPWPPPASHELWLEPNIGSVDLIDMFQSPGRWPATRGRLQVFGLYAAQVSSAPCPSCGPNVLSALALAQAFSKLASWGIAEGADQPARG